MSKKSYVFSTIRENSSNAHDQKTFLKKVSRCLWAFNIQFVAENQNNQRGHLLATSRKFGKSLPMPKKTVKPSELSVSIIPKLRKLMSEEEAIVQVLLHLQNTWASRNRSDRLQICIPSVTWIRRCETRRAICCFRPQKC